MRTPGKRAELANYLATQRVRRATYAARTASHLGIYICLLAGALDLWFGQIPLATASLITGAGCLATYLAIQKPGWIRQENAWVFCFFGLWAATFPLFLATNGMKSPYFGLHLVILLQLGLVIQDRFTLRQVLLFVFANFAAWTGVEAFGGTSPAPEAPYILVAPRLLLYFLGVGAVGYAFLRSERTIAVDAIARKAELLEANSQLERASQMAEVGDLIASTAHEIAQPLQTVSLGASILKRLSEQPEPNRERMQALSSQLTDAFRKSSRLLEQLKNFSRNDDFQAATLDLREPLWAISSLIRMSFEIRGVKFRMEIPEWPLWVHADSLRLQQILLNLLNNARDGSLTSETPTVTLSLESMGTWNRIRITNNGRAIPSSIQPQLFSRCITTKERGRGTGLGLKICYQLVQDHQGRVLFSSEEGTTTFVVDLPQIRAEKVNLTPVTLTRDPSRSIAEEPSLPATTTPKRIS